VSKRAWPPTVTGKHPVNGLGQGHARPNLGFQWYTYDHESMMATLSLPYVRMQPSMFPGSTVEMHVVLLSVMATLTGARLLLLVREK